MDNEIQTKKQRIVFKIDKDLYKDFKMHAKKSGITKTKLLARWITEAQHIHNKQTNIQRGNKILFNAYMDPEAIAKIDRLASLIGLNRSGGLRQLIQNRMNPTDSMACHIDKDININRTEVEVEALYKKGKYSEIEYLLNDDIELYSDELLYIYGVVNSELNNTQKASEAKSLLFVRSKKQDNTSLLAQSLYIQGLSLVYLHKDIEAVESLMRAADMTDSVAQRGLLGKIYTVLGEAYYRLDQHEKSK